MPKVKISEVEKYIVKLISDYRKKNYSTFTDDEAKKITDILIRQISIEDCIQLRSQNTGISCPKCSSELEDSDDFMLLSDPAQYNVKCSNGDCDFNGTRY